MLRDDAVTMIQRGLGFRTDRQDEIIAAIQQAQRLFERGKTLPWFLVEEDATVTLSEGANTAALPTGFLRPAERSGGLRYQKEVDGGWYWLDTLPNDEARATSFTSDTGLPSVYVLRKATFLFNRTASEDVTLKMDYYKSGDALTSNVENSWLAYMPDLLIGAGGVIVAKQLRDKQAQQDFAELVAEAWNAVLKEDAIRRTADRRVILGRNS